jgi:hypothetical protein
LHVKPDGAQAPLDGTEGQAGQLSVLGRGTTTAKSRDVPVQCSPSPNERTRRWNMICEHGAGTATIVTGISIAASISLTIA